MDRASFLRRASLLLLAPTAARAIDFGALAEIGGGTARLVSPARTITLAGGAGNYLAPMDAIRNEITGEVLRVTAISGDSLTVTRAT